MKKYHLNCGTLYSFGSAGLFGTGGLLKPGRSVIHCILLETDDGLVLIDTGFGIRDCTKPTSFMRIMMGLGGCSFDVAETAFMQVQKLGYEPEDVNHIVLTHFHYDHVGGLPDFPKAKVHIFKGEYEAVINPQDLTERLPYRKEHWAHGPQWEVYSLQGDKWFGLDSTTLVDFGDVQFCMVPLQGHTRGHCGIALRLPTGWLLHCGDGYTYHGEVDVGNPRHPKYYKLFRPLFYMSKPFRVIGNHTPRLRQLLLEHGDEVQLTCTHDPVELEKFLI